MSKHVVQFSVYLHYSRRSVFIQLQEECYEALESISRKINNNDADMRSHVILSMIKVAAAEADVPDLPPSGSWRPGVSPSLLVFNVLVVSTISHTFLRLQVTTRYNSVFFDFL